VVPVQALKGGNFSIYPEIDEGFPALIEQQRETYMKMLEMQDEEFNKILPPSEDTPCFGRKAISIFSAAGTASKLDLATANVLCPQ